LTHEVRDDDKFDYALRHYEKREREDEDRMATGRGGKRRVTGEGRGLR